MGAGSCKEKSNVTVAKVKSLEGQKKDGDNTVSSFDPEAARKRNQEIEKKLNADKKLENSTVKLLLLGGGESGKSTIAKQMKILHSNGFDESELEHIRYIAQNNVLTSIQQLIQGTNTLSITLSQQNNDDIELFAAFKSARGNILDQDIGLVIKRLWESPAFQTCYENRHDFELLESAKYFLSDIERIAMEDYTPSSQDALRCRLVTTGINESRFQFKNKLFRLIDVGGQRSERRKWIHSFDDVTAILFVTSMSEYDQNLAEDENTNRMQDSLELFSKISNMNIFVKTPIILFLNKKDVFEEKIKRHPISDYFPAYKGKPGNYEQAAEFIRDMFRERTLKDKQFYPHFTNATDTTNVDVVFGACMDIFMSNRFADTGVY